MGACASKNDPSDQDDYSPAGILMSKIREPNWDEMTFTRVVDSFEKMNLRKEILEVCSFEKPTAVQQRAIIPCLGGYDVAVQAPPKTGKTTTLAISVLERIDPSLNECQALVLTSSRELARRTQEIFVFCSLLLENVKCHACTGDTNIQEDARRLEEGVQVVVGTPGRIHDIIIRKCLRMNHIRMVVLDEADEMFFHGFVEQIYSVFLLSPNDVQVILFSTSMPENMLKFIKKIMCNPVQILDEEGELVTHQINTNRSEIEKDFPIDLEYRGISPEAEENEIIEPDSDEVDHEAEKKEIIEPDSDEVDHEAEKKETIEPTFDKASGFEGMNLKKELLDGIFHYGFGEPYLVQQRAIVPCIKGQDVLVQAGSESGKTVMALISILQRINPALDKCQALFLTLSRDIALQTQMAALTLGNFMENFKCHGSFLNGAQVVLGTPAKIHLVPDYEFWVDIDHIKVIVLDDVDKMLLNEGSEEHIFKVFQELPQDVQIILLSSTITSEVLKISQKLQRNPVQIVVKEEELVMEGIKQFQVLVEREEWKLETLLDIFDTFFISWAVIFCNSRCKVDWLTEKINEKDLIALPVHGGFSEEQNEKCIEEFMRKGSCRALITTDLYARGMGIAQVPFIINYDLPSCENYIHRIGRDGCFGRKGFAINLVTIEQKECLRAIEEYYNINIKPAPVPEYVNISYVQK